MFFLLVENSIRKGENKEPNLNMRTLGVYGSFGEAREDLVKLNRCENGCPDFVKNGLAIQVWGGHNNVLAIIEDLGGDYVMVDVSRDDDVIASEYHKDLVVPFLSELEYSCLHSGTTSVNIKKIIEHFVKHRYEAAVGEAVIHAVKSGKYLAWVNDMIMVELETGEYLDVVEWKQEVDTEIISLDELMKGY